MLQPFAIFGLYFGTAHDIPDTIEFDLSDLPDFEALYFEDTEESALDWGYDWDYLYQPGDMVEDEIGRVGIIQFIASADESPFDDGERYYYVIGKGGKWGDYLTPDQIRYAVGR